MKKFQKKICGVFLICMGLSVSLLFGFSKQAFATETIAPNQNNYQTVTEVSEEQYLENISGIEEVTGQKLLTLIQSDDTFSLYFGYKECPYCREFSKVLSEFKSQTSLPLYYVNMSTITSDLTSEEKQSINSFLNDMAEFYGTPTFLKMQNGKVIGNYVGSNVTLGQLLDVTDEDEGVIKIEYKAECDQSDCPCGYYLAKGGSWAGDYESGDACVPIGHLSGGGH